MNGITYRVGSIDSPQDIPFDLSSMGIHGSNHKRIIHRPSGTATYLFLQLHQAGLIGQTYVKGNTFIIWEPGHPHRYGNRSIVWTNSWFNVTGNDVLNRLRRHHIPLNEPFRLHQPQLFEKYLRLLLDEMREHIPYSIQVVSNLFDTLLLELERDLNQEKGSSVVPESLKEVKFLLDTRYEHSWNLRSLARTVRLSPNYLTSRFKSYFGQPVMAYLFRVRMSHAADLLGNINLPVGEIASLCGFQDLFHFSKSFRRFHGMSPTAYRDHR